MNGIEVEVLTVAPAVEYSHGEPRGAGLVGAEPFPSDGEPLVGVVASTSRIPHMGSQR